jgi:hypothetical protein
MKKTQRHTTHSQSHTHTYHIHITGHCGGDGMLPWDGIKCDAEENVVSIRLTVYRKFRKFAMLIERKVLVSSC